MPEVLEQIKGPVLKAHYRDMETGKIYKFEYCSINYVHFWLEDKGITKYQCIYFENDKGEVVIKAKDYKPHE